jgi:L-malate glycosyltransferase
MRILQISSGQQFGGGERHVSELCHSLAIAGHKIHLAVRPLSPLPLLLSDLPDITCHELPLRGALDLLSAYRLAKLIEQMECEIVHAHYARDYPLTALAVRYCRRRRSPLPAFFITRHHYLPLKGNWAYRKLLGQLDCAIAVSQSVRETLSRSFGWNSRNNGLPSIEVVPNWIDLTKFLLSDSDQKKYRKEFGIKEGSAAIGLINQIGEAKGQAVLLRAAALLSKSRDDIQIVLAGKEHAQDQSYTRYLKRLVVELGIRDRVIFAGHVDRLPQLLWGLDMVVIPSENEAFSIVCLEAMASRRPVIASAAGGLAELIEHEKTGLLFPVGDVEELARQIEHALTFPDLCRQMTEAAYEFVKERFDRQKQITRIEGLYCRAIERRWSVVGGR